MLHTILVWQSILFQVGLAPGGPQGLVQTTHLTHGHIAHGASFASLSHQNVKEFKWMHVITGNLVPVPASPTLPLKTLQATIQGGKHPLRTVKPYFPLASTSSLELLSLLHHLTGITCCDHCQHNASSSSLLIPTLWPLTNTAPPTPTKQAIFTATSITMHVERESKERGWSA